jgi:hypothetical protein
MDTFKGRRSKNHCGYIYTAEEYKLIYELNQKNLEADFAELWLSGDFKNINTHRKRKFYDAGLIKWKALTDKLTNRGEEIISERVKIISFSKE